MNNKVLSHLLSVLVMGMSCCLLLCLSYNVTVHFFSMTNGAKTPESQLSPDER